MSTKLFKNTEGKVLMSVGNKLIKQPYEFGLAFQNRMGLNNYIKITGLDVQVNSFTLFAWYNTIATNTNLFSFETTEDSLSLYSYGGNTLSSLTKNGRIGNNINIIGSTSGILNGLNLFGVGLSETSFYLGFNKYNQVGYTTTNLPTSNISIALIGAYSSSKSLISYLTIPINRQILFSRQLSQQEFNYYYNNNLGNNPQSNTGVVYDLKCDFAEVINVSGVDQPCVRDYSGNNHHGVIMNLPAGTAQQKVDYANANLFVPFQ